MSSTSKSRAAGKYMHTCKEMYVRKQSMEYDNV